MTTIDHAVVTGQSLAGGLPDTGQPAIAECGPQANPSNVMALTSAGDLTGLQHADQQYPDYSLGNRVFAGAAGRAMTFNTHWFGGTAYLGLKKGGSSGKYEEAISFFNAGKTKADGRGDVLRARALHIIHGEQDENDGTSRSTYLGYLQQWLADYNTDLKAVTGQAEDIVGIVCQVSRSTVGATGIALAQLDAHRTLDRFYCVGPKYHMPSVGGTHLTAAGYYYWGEYHAKVHKAVVVDGGDWNPVVPQTITASDRQIAVKFHVPVAPLVFDTTTLAAQTNHGFDVRDDGGSLGIKSLVIEGGDTVLITLNRKPERGTPRVAYARTGRFGNLRDSDPAVSALDATPLRNWSCYFDDALTPPAPTPASPGRWRRVS